MTESKTVKCPRCGQEFEVEDPQVLIPMHLCTPGGTATGSYETA